MLAPPKNGDAMSTSSASSASLKEGNAASTHSAPLGGKRAPLPARPASAVHAAEAAATRMLTPSSLSMRTQSCAKRSAAVEQGGLA